MSDSLRPHGLQHARLPCPSPTPGAYTNSCPLSWWCNHLILCHPLLLPPSIFPSIRVFSNGSVLHIRWPKFWSFSFNIRPSNEYSGLISLRMDFESVMPSNHLILCHLLLLPPSVFPRIRVFSSESVLHIRWPKYWSFSFSISPSNEYSGLISFRMDWFDLAVQGTLKSLLQHHSSKASILWRWLRKWSEPQSVPGLVFVGFSISKRASPYLKTIFLL